VSYFGESAREGKCWAPCLVGNIGIEDLEKMAAFLTDTGLKI
jgi:hypothetical protein